MYKKSFFQKQLDAHFSVTDLLILSYDYFLPVYRSFKRTPMKKELVEAIVTYCQNDTQQDILVNQIVRANPMMHPDNWTILVIEDDSSWQRRLKRYIKELGCTVITANDYDEAKMELSNPKLTLVTVDLNLNTSDEYAEGIDLLGAIREKFGSQFPIIVVSGTDKRKQLIQVINYHVSAFIEKAEFSREKFIASVLNEATSYLQSL